MARYHSQYSKLKDEAATGDPAAVDKFERFKETKNEKAREYAAKVKAAKNQTARMKEARSGKYQRFKARVEAGDPVALAQQEKKLKYIREYYARNRQQKSGVPGALADPSYEPEEEEVDANPEVVHTSRRRLLRQETRIVYTDPMDDVDVESGTHGHQMQVRSMNKEPLRPGNGTVARQKQALGRPTNQPTIEAAMGLVNRDAKVEPGIGDAEQVRIAQTYKNSRREHPDVLGQPGDNSPSANHQIFAQPDAIGTDADRNRLAHPFVHSDEEVPGVAVKREVDAERRIPTIDLTTLEPEPPHAAAGGQNIQQLGGEEDEEDVRLQMKQAAAAKLKVDLALKLHRLQKKRQS